MLGWIIAEEKTEGPAQVLTFAGIELDTLNMISRLPMDKLRNYSGMITEIQHCRKITMKEMKSIIGCLQFSTWLTQVELFHRLINTTIGINVPYHNITMNVECKKDLMMWRNFLLTPFYISELLAGIKKQLPSVDHRQLINHIILKKLIIHFDRSTSYENVCLFWLIVLVYILVKLPCQKTPKMSFLARFYKNVTAFWWMVKKDGNIVI